MDDSTSGGVVPVVAVGLMAGAGPLPSCDGHARSTRAWARLGSVSTVGSGAIAASLDGSVDR